jgi:hypothetical protein
MPLSFREKKARLSSRRLLQAFAWAKTPTPALNVIPGIAFKYIFTVFHVLRSKCAKINGQLQSLTPYPTA